MRDTKPLPMPALTPTTQDDPDDASQRWLRAPGWQRAEVLLWGAHGGAGTTTLAAWLHPACDMGSLRPGLYPRYPAFLAQSRPLIVVCGTTTQAAQAATVAVTAVTRAGAHVAVLAVIGDGWPEPATATARFRLLEPQADAVIRIPFVPAMRLVDEPSANPVPRQARRAIDQVRAAAGLTPLSSTRDLLRRS